MILQSMYNQTLVHAVAVIWEERRQMDCPLLLDRGLIYDILRNIKMDTTHPISNEPFFFSETFFYHHFSF